MCELNYPIFLIENALPPFNDRVLQESSMWWTDDIPETDEFKEEWLW